MAIRCNTGPGYNGGPCGPAPCTGECGPDVDRDVPGTYTKACGCTHVPGPGTSWDIHDPWPPQAVNG